MAERKVVPITGKHTTMSSMLAEAMADERCVRGFSIYFDEEGTMRHGHVGVMRSDVCMAQMYLTMLGVEMMQQEDD
jgi:hypothetical protein